mmetsp:Transcript_18532/g.52049  ORF Transcript_18532/g.52049 Transcript_18532/m.52049 type:complete len:287 (+) Transcript_18532:265-1125(+)
MSLPASKKLLYALGLLNCVADVVAGGELLQILLCMGRQTFNAIDKLHHRLLRHLLPPRECLELLVRVGHRVPAHDCLDGLRKHLPAVVQVPIKDGAVELQLGHALQSRGIGKQGVPQAHTQVAQHCGVSEISLPSTDGQLVAHVVHGGVGHAQVALAVLKVDGVYFMGHCGGAHLASDCLLLEVAEGNVAPDVAVKVNEDVVEPDDSMVQLRDVVVGLDLGDVGVEGEAQRIHKLLCYLLPVHLGVCGQVRVVVANGTCHLAEERHLSSQVPLPLQPRGKNSHLFP